MITNKKMKTKERITSQKTIVLDYLRSVKTHPTAEEVYLAVKKKLPRISRGTVYRILKQTAKKGEILEIPQKISHFDADISPHSHFICEKCQRIYDLFEKGASLKIPKTKVGKIKNYQIYFYGICKKCK